MIQLLNNHLIYRFSDELKIQYEPNIKKLCKSPLEWRDSFYIILLHYSELEILRTKEEFNLDLFLNLKSLPLIKGLRRIKKRKEVYFLSVEWLEIDKMRESLRLPKRYYNIDLCRKIC